MNPYIAITLCTAGLSAIFLGIAFLDVRWHRKRVADLEDEVKHRQSLAEAYALKCATLTRRLMEARCRCDREAESLGMDDENRMFINLAVARGILKEAEKRGLK